MPPSNGEVESRCIGLAPGRIGRMIGTISPFSGALVVTSAGLPALPTLALLTRSASSSLVVLSV